MKPASPLSQQHPDTVAVAAAARQTTTAMVRLWAVELRKLIDTPTGVALLAVGAVLAGVFGGGTMLLREGVDYGQVAQMAAVPATVLAPVLAVLLATSERSHRTALTTFALVPRRGRVLSAKAGAVVTMAAAVTLLALLAGVLILPVGSLVVGGPIVWAIAWSNLGWLTLGTVVACLSAFAVGLLIGNAPAAIVVVLVWPLLSSGLASVPTVGDVIAWMDVGATSAFRDGITGREVARALSGIAVWVLLPGAIGWIRQLRSDL